MLIPLLMMWKDWGFSPSLFGQAKHFLELARHDTDPQAREGHIRASIVFSHMAFEAYFREAVLGYIQQRSSAIDKSKLKQVEGGLHKRTGIQKAIREWPTLLTGQPLDSGTKLYKDWVNFTQYRNSLLHGKITEPISSSGKLAQEVETIEDAELAMATIAGMINAVAGHFKFDVPTWV
jgi:hypothetical protein